MLGGRQQRMFRLVKGRYVSDEARETFLGKNGGSFLTGTHSSNQIIILRM